MSSAAKMASTDNESTGFSVMDIVKHGIRTLIHSLGENDRLSLVGFSTDARKVCDLIDMTESGKQQALSSTQAFTPNGTTNIWGGLEMGMNILYGSLTPGRFPVLMLLTDGQPNVIPPNGHMHVLQKYAKDHNGLPCRINTFGFGYNLDSKLLHELAVEGGGMFSFIPDCSFVGTVFVNALSNYLSTMATNVTLAIDEVQPSGAEYVVLGGHPTTKKAGGGITINLGSLTFGQPKNLVIKSKTGSFPPFQGELNLKVVTTGAQQTITQAEVAGDANDFARVVHQARLEMVDTIRNAAGFAEKKQLAPAGTTVQQCISDTQAKLSSCDVPEVSEILSKFLEDLEGEVTNAVSKQDFYEKWGLHYLPSLMQAHLLQQCNNFKDPGIQHYGGNLFRDIRDIADDIFCKLPPPTPSLTTTPSAPQVSSMSYFHNSSAPCFAGTCIVQMGDGSTKQVCKVAAGDFVYTGQLEEPVKVLCVVKTEVRGGKANLVLLEGGLLVTPYHPVKVNGDWKFPVEIAPVSTYACDAVFSFVLEKAHVMFINRIPCISLGHGFTGNKVLEHSYLGTNAVIEDLKKFEGWSSGIVVLKSENIVRGSQTGSEPGKICGIAITVDKLT